MVEHLKQAYMVFPGSASGNLRAGRTDARIWQKRWSREIRRKNTADPFERYLQAGRPRIVARYGLRPDDAVRLIRGAHRVPVLARPARLRERTQHILPALIRFGLLGIECYYGPYDESTVARLLGLAQDFSLVANAGTDHHSPGIPPTALGEPCVPPEAVHTLLARSKTLMS